jgi:hypothetical protein
MAEALGTASITPPKEYLQSKKEEWVASVGDLFVVIFLPSEFIPPSEIANWERRLGYKLPDIGKMN